jgi:thymidylate synthase
MANKTPNNEPKTNTNDSQDLQQLKQILFGSAQSQLEKSIEDLSQRFDKRCLSIEKKMADNHKAMQQALASGIESLTDKLNNADQGQTEELNHVNDFAKQTSSELEMYETATRQEFDDTNTRFEQEIAALTRKFNEQHKKAMQQLSSVSHELHNSKTDRKTLAKLLATMATNLEDDEQA